MHHFRTTDFEDEYDGMLLQTGFADHWPESKAHHSQYWRDRVKDESLRTNTELREALAEEAAEENPKNEHHYHTVDLGDEYNGMLVQTDESYSDHWADKRHSQYWRDRVHDEAFRTNQQLMEAYSRDAAVASPRNPAHYAASHEDELESEYNGMLLQQQDSGYDGFSDPWRDFRIKAVQHRAAEEDPIRSQPQPIGALMQQ